MKITTIAKLQEKFVGKICTIITLPIPKQNFSDTQFADFFTCLIKSLDQDGIFATHPTTGCENFYNLSHVVGIIEEQVFYEDNPEHAEIISKVRDLPKTKSNPNDFANIDLMTKLSKN
jgi:hypothetical protein